MARKSSKATLAASANKVPLAADGDESTVVESTPAEETVTEPETQAPEAEAPATEEVPEEGQTPAAPEAPEEAPAEQDKRFFETYKCDKSGYIVNVMRRRRRTA